MYYSSFGILAVVLHIIINQEILLSGRKAPRQSPAYRYRQFLISILIFYIADLLWGFLVESGIRTLAYADTVVFFATMATSVFLWTRYVVAFLDKRGIRAKSFLAAGWVIFGFVVFHLIINFFYPVIFTFTEDTEYVAKSGRYVLLIAQFILFASITVYSLFVSVRTTGRERVHYRAVCLSGGVMALFIVIQSLNPLAPFYTIGCLLANCVIHVFVEEDEKREKERITEETRKDRERFNQISTSLAKNYDAIYYINIETGKYFEFSTSEAYDSMNVPKKGEDFYAETRENARRYAHPDDREFAVSMYYKETMLKNIEGRISYAYRYRIMVGDEARYFRFVVNMSDDGKHFVLCDKDINDTMTAESAMLEKQKVHITFSRIAESLASNYDVIYYVDVITGEYTGYTSQNIYGGLTVEQEGEDFFSDVVKNTEILLHPQDRERFLGAMEKDQLLTELEDRKEYDIEYRHLIDGVVSHIRLSVRKSSDNAHFILGVENIDEEVKARKEHLQALRAEKELARRDELTGIRNKTAFAELEKSVQDNIEKGMDYLAFAIAVCDINDLKLINDTKGHTAGDEYICAAAKLLCDTFDHSPVFRIGGDEFAVFLRGEDYLVRTRLLEELCKTVLSNRETGEGPVVAVGMSKYRPGEDVVVSDIFDRADKRMYENKRALKTQSG